MEQLPVKDFALLIPCYNNYDGLVRSLNSVYYKTDKFEIYIIDDGSTPPIEDKRLKNDIQQQLPITIIRLPENKGITFALNTALEKIRLRPDIKFIARLDCGDICTMERFNKQVQYMTLNTDIALTGTGVLFKDYKTGANYIYKNKNEHSDIEKQMYFRCSFIHPSVMFKKELIGTIGFYPEKYTTCEDYAYFFKIVNKYVTYILPEVLVICEINSKGISATHRKKQLLTRLKVINQLGNRFLLKFAGSVQLLLNFATPLFVVDYLKKR